MFIYLYERVVYYNYVNIKNKIMVFNIIIPVKTLANINLKNYTTNELEFTSKHYV